MPLDDLTASHLAKGGTTGAFEEQRGNNGIIQIFDVEGNVSSSQHKSGLPILTLSLQSFALPKTNLDALETNWLNEKRKFAGTVTFDDLEIVFKDFVDVNTAHIVKKWHEKVYDPSTGKIGLARDYKKTALITLFAPNGTFERHYFVEGIWPLTFDPGSIDMTSAEPIKITCTFAIDKAYAAETPGPANLEAKAPAV